MANPEESMFKEAMAAVLSGDRARARDLITRLLKINQNNPEYWLWMSAMVETARERTYCLQEVLRRDAHNLAARRGMQILGIAGPDVSQVVPARLQRRNWEPAILGTEDPARQMAARSLRLVLVGAGVLALVVTLVVVGILAARRPVYTGVVATADLSYKPSATFLPTNSPVVRSATPTFIGPTPLWMQLAATYTPTPLVVNTPHAASEAYRIGMRAYARQDWQGMQSYMAQAATVQPDQPDLVYYLGEANRFEGDTGSAINYYNQAIGIDPHFAPAYLGLARAILADDPSAREEPIQDLQRAIELDPKLGEAYLELANLYNLDRRYADALKLLDQAATVLPESPLLPLYRGQALLKLGQAEDALAEARRANQLDFTLLPAYRLLGEALLANGQPGEAFQPLETYLTYVSGDPQVYLLLAQAYEGSGDSEAALKAYDQAIGMNARLLEAYQQRAGLYLRKGEYELAIQDYKKADSLDKTNYLTLIGMGKAYFEQRIYGSAYMSFERANGTVDGDKQKAEVLYWRGQSLAELGEIEAALRDFKALLALPKGAADPQWLTLAATQAASLSTPTRTPVTPTLTNTPRPTATPITPTLTRTRQPSATPTPTSTPRP